MNHVAFELNEYQLQVVRHLIEYDVQFLVIGGFVRQVLSGKPTRDLDLWVDISETNKRRLIKALHAWAVKYSTHVPIGGFNFDGFGPGYQIHLPINEALYLDGNSNVQKIECDDGVDILTSVEGFNFNEAWKRGVDWHGVDISLRLMSLDDVGSKKLLN